MIRRPALFLLLLLPVALHAQVSVTASHIVDAFDRPMSSAKLCFAPVDATGAATGFRVGSTQVVSDLVCGIVSNGVLQSGLTVMPSQTGTYYHIYAADRTSNRIIRDYGMTPITGTSWTLDSYDPNLAVLPVTAIQVGTVSELPSTSAPTATITGSGPYQLNLGIPQGQQGQTGSQGLAGSAGPAGGLQTTTYASLPTANASNKNTVYLVTDATSASTCNAGGGTYQAICGSNGTAWVALGGVGGGAAFPSTTGVVCNTSTTASANCSSAQVQSAIGSGVYDASGAAAAAQAASDPSGSAAAAQAASVPTTRTVNGHALSANVTISATDITTGLLPTGVVPSLSPQAALVSALKSAGTVRGIYLFTECSGTTLTDLSGNGNNGTWAATGTPPTWGTDGAACYLYFPLNATQYVSFPGITDPSAIQIITNQDPGVNSFAGNLVDPILGYSNSAQTFSFGIANGNVGSPTLYYPTASSYAQLITGTTQTPKMANYAPWTLNLQGTASVYNGLVPVTTTSTTEVPLTGGFLTLGHGYFTGTAYYTAYKKTYALVVYGAGSSLTTQTMANNLAAFQTYFATEGINTNAQKPSAATPLQYTLTCGITSIENGYNSGQPPCQPAQLNLGSSWTIYQNGAAINSSQMVPDCAAGFPAYSPFVLPGSTNIAFLGDACTNDQALSANGTACINAMPSCIAKLKGLGYQNVVVGTMISRTGQDTFKNTFNAVVRAGATVWGASLCDIAANPLLGADGANTDADFNTDHVHPLPPGDSLYSAEARACFQSITGASEAAPNGSTATSYTMTPADNVLIRTPTAAATDTLPDCLGLTGYRYKIVDASSSFGITEAGVNSETITGSASVSASSVAVFTSELISPSAAGCYWLRTQ